MLPPPSSAQAAHSVTTEVNEYLALLQRRIDFVGETQISANTPQ